MVVILINIFLKLQKIGSITVFKSAKSKVSVKITTFTIKLTHLNLDKYPETVLPDILS
jgi:hypothetical protein